MSIITNNPWADEDKAMAEALGLEDYELSPEEYAEQARRAEEDHEAWRELQQELAERDAYVEATKQRLREAVEVLRDFDYPDEVIMEEAGLGEA